MMDKRTEAQLTAYALGELALEEVAEVETTLAEDADARRFVNDMHRLGELAGEAYGSDGLGDERRRAVLSHARVAPQPMPRGFWNVPSRRRVLTLAASAAVVLGLGYVSVGVIESDGDLRSILARAFGSSAMVSDGDFPALEEAVLRSQSLAGLEVQTRERWDDESKAANVTTPGESDLPNSANSYSLSYGVNGQVDLSGVSDVGANELYAPPAPTESLGVGAAPPASTRGSASGLAARAPDRYYGGGSLAGRGGRGGGGGMSLGALGGSAGGGFGGVAGGADPNSVSVDSLKTQMQALGYLGDSGRGQTTWEYTDGEAPQRWNVQPQTARIGNLASLSPQSQPTPTHNTETYDRVIDNPFKRAIDEPLSTFSIDVDTGSYANVRRFLRNGQLPPKDAVRIEELLNYFDYEYAPPANADPFSAHVELVECPWNDEHRLMRIGLKGREVEVTTRPRANLVFLLDVSGSMKPANKLPLVRDAMQLLTKQLRPDDKVAIVTYAGNSGLVLPSTLGMNQSKILNAIANLGAGGSTNGASGIELAYQVAQEHFFDEGVNRVILATDGDFNVGITDRGSLDRLIEEKAKSGVFLTVLGVGEGNLKDATMEQLADKGNGQYAYLDSEREARKVLVEQVGGTLVTIAKDVKIQIDFNPMAVGEYRLIGYENRVLAAQDFVDDTKDAGEIGAGHAVTALYEITPPTTTDYPETSGTQSRYVTRVPAGADTMGTLADGTEVPQLLTVKLRYKEPDGDTSRLLEIPITAQAKPMVDASRDTRFAASVAAFGMALRESPYRGTVNWDLIANLAEDGLGDDPHGYRKEFMEMVRVARGLKPGIELASNQPVPPAPDEIELIAIRPFSGGTWVAEIRVPGERPKRFGVGEGFGSFKVISIDPAAQRVVIYSEEHRREITLRVAN